MQKEELKRYNRQIILSEIGIDGQKKLKAAKVLIIGAGGLGCPILQYLVAAGIGSVGIVDDDMVDETNLHRQILYSYADIGKNKAETAVKKLRIINPFIDLRSFPVRLSPENADDIVSQYDLIVDGSDNFATRYLANDTCVNLGKPLVFGSIFGFEGQVSVFNYKGGPTYRCVFPESGNAANCAENGVLGILPGITGSFMANEVLKLVLGIGEPLSGKLMVMNVLDNTFNLFKISKLSENEVPLVENKITSKPNEARNRLSIAELETWLDTQSDNIYLVDVREPNEFEAENLGGVNIPLSEISDESINFPSGKKVVFYCNSGRRSKLAYDMLKETGHSGETFWV